MDAEQRRTGVGQIGSRHHYVPRFYLSRFADRSQLIKRINRHTGETNVANIKNFATERDFYTRSGERGELDASLEVELSALERDASKAIRQLCNPLFSFNVSDETRLAVCRFVAAQKVRGRLMRRTIEQMTEMLEQVAGGQLVERYDAERGPYVVRRSPESEAEAGHLLSTDPDAHLENLESLGDAILREILGWQLFIAEYEDPLLFTSDETCVSLPAR